MSAVKLSLSILIWVSLVLSLLFILNRLANELKTSVREHLSEVCATVLSLLDEKLPEGGWIKIKVTRKEVILPLKEPMTLLPGHEYIIFRGESSLVIEEKN